jgi:DNA repair exonuclease SbcCD ATPase subunit
LRELDSEATSLWREDNRGKPAAKVIERQILDLRSEGRKAEQRDRTARSLSESIQHLSEQLARLESKERQLRARQSQFERLMPIRNLMRQVDQNRQQAGDISPWQFIAEDPLQRVETLKEEIDVLRHEKSQKETRLERLKEKIDGFSEHEEALARLSGEIRAWATRLGGLEQIRELLGEARERLRHCEERIEKQGRELFMEDWNTSLTDKVLAVPVREIRSALREYQSCQEDVRRSAEKRTKRISGWEKHLLPLAVLLAAFGLTSGTLSLFLPGRVLLPAGGVLILLAISMMALRWLLDRSNRLDIQAELGKTDSEVCVISDRLIDLFGGLPLGTQGIEGWDAYRVSDLRELRDSVVDKRAQQQRELNHQQQISCLEKQFGEWAHAQLESDVREAEGRKAQLSQLEASASELTNLLEPMESELRRLQTELTRLTSALEELGEGSVKQGAEVLLKRRKADDAAEHFQRALDTEFPDWEELKPQIADLETRSTLSTFQDETARLHAELEETTQQIRKFSAEKAAKAEELHQIESLPTRADIESEIAFLDRRLSDIHFKRDRLALLSQFSWRDLSAALESAGLRRRAQRVPGLWRRKCPHLEGRTSTEQGDTGPDLPFASPSARGAPRRRPRSTTSLPG